MFLSDSAFKSPLDFIKSSTQSWSAVELVTHNPWFLLTARLRAATDKKNAYSISHTVLMAGLAEVERRAQQTADADSIVESVLVVTPTWLNGTTTWQMEPLAAVWVGEEPLQMGEMVDVYETQAGKMYSLSYIETPVKMLGNLTLRYRFPALKLGPKAKAKAKAKAKSKSKSKIKVA